MKNTSFALSLLASGLAVICSPPAQAQNAASNVTVVSIRATVPAASEAGDIGRLLVSRGERTNGDLLVWLQIGGTAQNGVDYQTLSNIVLIPNGARGTEISVTPIDDAIPEPIETVVVRLVPSPLASPVPSYYISSTSGATVTIADNDHFVESTNTEPVTVAIVATDPHASEGLVMWCSNTVIGVNADAANIAWRTNCPNILGTNNAIFTVRRSGSTDAALRVYYAIGGTASNGIDYASLPGVVTIPAGRRSAEIVVRPIDDTIAEKLETVLLKLRQPPLPLDSADTAYAIGRPESAAAFIVDNDTAAPPPRVLPDGMFNACEHLTNGCFRVEISPNLVNWEIICTNAVADGMARHIDPDAANNLRRFYRFIPIPCPPDEP